MFSSVQFSSVAQSCRTLRPMNRSMPGLPVHHQLPEFTQTHVHRVGDAIQPFHPLSSPFLLPAIPHHKVDSEVGQIVPILEFSPVLTIMRKKETLGRQYLKTVVDKGASLYCVDRYRYSVTLKMKSTWEREKMKITLEQ